MLNDSATPDGGLYMFVKGARNQAHPSFTESMIFEASGTGATVIKSGYQPNNAVIYIGKELSGNDYSDIQIKGNLIDFDATTVDFTGVTVTGLSGLGVGDNSITKAKMADDAVGSAELDNVVTLVIKNSSGTALKTLYGAGA